MLVALIKNPPLMHDINGILITRKSAGTRTIMTTTNDHLSESRTGDTEPSQQKPPSFFQVMLSVIAAAFGVQTNKNYERDFSTGNPLAYIVGGLLFTVLFILTIAGIVSLVLP